MGILKSLGFSNRTVFGVLLGQSMILCGSGGLLGLALALASEAPIKQAVAAMLPGYNVLSGTVLLALAVTLGVGLVAGLWPAMRASRLEVVTALSDR